MGGGAAWVLESLLELGSELKLTVNGNIELT